MKIDGAVVPFILVLICVTDGLEANFLDILFPSCDRACLIMLNSSRAVFFNGEPCPSLMTTVGTGARALDECVCVAGTYGNYSSGCVECVGAEYCPRNSLVPTECPEGYSCTPDLATPLAGNWVNGTFELCPTGFFCGDWNSTPAECGVGMFCGMGSLSPEPCPAGLWCPDATTLEPVECPAGSYCEAGSSAPLPCPASMYCVNGSAAGVPCDPGYFCPVGSSNQTECLAGFMCEMGTGNMTVCPENFFCPAMTSHPVICPIGSYCGGGMQAFPTQCAAGYYGVSPWCVRCPILMESADMATTCVCKTGLFFVFDNASHTGNRVLENGRCVNTSLFCPRNSYCGRDGGVLPCPAGSSSSGGAANITGCVCNNGGVIFGSECVNGTAAPSAAAAAVSVAVIAGGATAGAAVVGVAFWGASAAGLFGGGSTVAAAAIPAATNVIPTAASSVIPTAVHGVGGVGGPALRSMFDVTATHVPVMLGVPAFLQEIRVDLQRKTV